MKSWKLCTLAVILAAISVMLFACGDSSVSPASPTSLPAITGSAGDSYGGSSLGSSSGTTTTAGGAQGLNEGRQFTVLNGADVLAKQDCRNNEAGWFLPDGYDVRVRIDKNLEHDYRMVGNLFWAPEPNCDPTNSQPIAGSSFERTGANNQHLLATFSPIKDCGRYQWDLIAINDTTGERHNVFFGVLNTGRERCTPPPSTPPPPPQGCPEEQITGEDGKCYPVCQLGGIDLRGLGLASVDESPSCLCPGGSLPDPQFGCREPSCEDLNPPSNSTSGPNIDKSIEKGSKCIGSIYWSRRVLTVTGSATFYNQGGYAQLNAASGNPPNGKDRGSVPVACGGQGTVELKYVQAGDWRCDNTPNSYPSHWNNTFSIAVTQPYP